MPEEIQWKKVEPKMWNFEESPKLQGEYIGKKEEVGTYKSTVYKVRLEDGQVMGFWGCTVLDIRMEALKPGDLVMIEYKGKEVNPKTQAEYKNYEVFLGEL